MSVSQSTCANPAFTVFVSHAAPDKETMAIPLREKLTELGVNAFVDKLDMRVGKDASEAVTLAMETARVAVIILSPEYAARSRTIKELQYFQKRIRKAGSKGLVKPIIITLFYRLTIKDCHGNFLHRMGDDGKSPFLDAKTRFTKRRSAGQQEANRTELCETMQMLPKTFGIENDENASNDNSEEMKQKRDKLLDKVTNAVMSSLQTQQLQFAQERIEVNMTKTDKYRAIFEVPANRTDVSIDIESRSENGDWLTAEGKVKSLVVERRAGCSNIVGVYGIGGVGKTTAVKHIGREKNVRQRFPDGVLFIQLGQDATIQKVIDELIRVVEKTGGTKLAEELRQTTDLIEVVNGAAEWFQDRSNLIIFDDVWEKDGVGQGFIHKVSEIVSKGKDSTLLFTARDSITAGEGPNRNIRFERKEPRGIEAIKILLRSAERPLSDWDDQDVRKEIEVVLESCFGLPLALNMAGKGVRMIGKRIGGDRKLVWNVYKRDLQKYLEGLLQERSHREYPALLPIVQVTLRLLDKRGVNGVWENRFSKLCVLEKQGWGTVGMLRKLWGIDSLQTTVEAMELLTDAGLVEIEGRGKGGNVVKGVRMHDLLNEVATEIAKEMGGVQGKHCDLLDSYGVGSGEADCSEWCSERIEVDHYIHQNLARHLVRSGRGKELLILLLWPAWVKRQMEVSGVGKLEEDFERALMMLKKWIGKDSSDLKGLNVIVEGKNMRGNVYKIRRALEMIKGAARLGSHIIRDNPQEAYFQIQARLVDIAKKDELLRQYLARIADCVDRPWLRAVNGFLDGPGGLLRKNISLGAGIRGMAKLGMDGRFVCGCDDGRLLIVNVLEDKIERAWQAHEDIVRSVTTFEDGKKIVSGSVDKTIKVWTEDGRHVKTFEGHEDDVRCVVLTGSEQHIVSGGLDGAKLWDIESGAVLQELEGVVLSVAVLRNDKFALLGGCEEIRKWKLNTKVRDLAFSRKIKRETEDKPKRETEDKPKRKTEDKLKRKLLIRMFRRCCWSNEGNADEESTGGREGNEKEPAKYDDSTQVNELQFFESVHSLALIKNSRVALAGCEDGRIRMLDTKTLQQIGNTWSAHLGTVLCMRVIEDRQLMISGSSEGVVRVWDIEERKEVSPPLRGHNLVTNMFFIEGGDGAATASDNGYLTVWDLRQNDAMKEVSRHGDSVTAVAFFPCGKRVLSGSRDKTVRVWDATTGHQIGKTLCGHSDWVSCVTVCPDGDRAVSGSGDTTLRVWDIRRWKEVQVLEAHTDEIACMVVTPDGRRVISGAEDSTLRVWDLESGGGSHVIMGAHSNRVFGVFISKDGLQVISCSEHEVIVWRLETRAIERKIDCRSGISPRQVLMAEVNEIDGSVSEKVWIAEEKHVVIGNKDGGNTVIGTLDTLICSKSESTDNRLCLGLHDGRIGFATIEY